MEIWIFLILVFVVLDLAFVIYIIWKRKHKGLTSQEKKKYLNNWRKIKEDQDYKHAIMGADKLLDVLLTGHGYNGTIGEKLKQSGGLFSDYNGVWTAHKLRNRIAHELDFEVSNKEAKNALRLFERAFRDLGLL